jgi:hypothetical protein
MVLRRWKGGWDRDLIDDERRSNFELRLVLVSFPHLISLKPALRSELVSMKARILFDETTTKPVAKPGWNQRESATVTETILSKICARNDFVYSLDSMCLYRTHIKQSLSGSRGGPDTCNLNLNLPRQNICIANCKQSQPLHLVCSKFDHWTNTSKTTVWSSFSTSTTSLQKMISKVTCLLTIVFWGDQPPLAGQHWWEVVSSRG